MENEKKNVSQIFGQNVKKYRKQAGFTQEELSEKLNISQKHLSIIETGIQFASATLIDRICEVLNVSAGMLFGSSGDVNIKEVNMISVMVQNCVNSRFSVIEEKLTDIENYIKKAQF